MFTGIVQDVGKVRKISKRRDYWELGIESDLVFRQTKLGQSVSVNGVCLTLKKKERGVFFCDAVSATLKISNLKRLRMGDYVNLELSLELDKRLDGHFVLGHIDTEVKLVNVQKSGQQVRITFRIPAEFSKYVVSKGPIAIDGMSLTVADFRNNTVSVNIIPYTWDNTNLKHKKTASYVNIEFDYLAKIVVENR